MASTPVRTWMSLQTKFLYSPSMFVDYTDGVRGTMDLEKLESLARSLPAKTFYGNGSGPFLTRYILCKLPGGGQVNLHFFHRGDEDPQLHNHPWPGRSLVLAGGYIEERRLPDGRIRKRTFQPGDSNEFEATTFHRVDLLRPEEGCWTLFTLGKKQQDWGFWDRRTGIYTPWRTFIEAKGLVPLD